MEKQEKQTPLEPTEQDRNHKIIRAILTSAVAATLVVGGSTYLWQKTSAKAKEQKLQQQIISLQNQLTRLQSECNTLRTQEIDSTTAPTRPTPPDNDLNLYQYGPGNYDFTLKHDGLDRKYKVHVPASYHKNTATPLVLNLHGGTGNAEAAKRYSLMDEKSDVEGFIVVYPEGTGPQAGDKTLGLWNAGRCCGPVSELVDDIDDIGFFNKMLDDLEGKFNIDKKRIYATGLSNGGLISYRIACEMSDRIAAVAPIAGHDSFDNCNPARSVPVIHFQGIDDPCVSYEGGECGGCFAEIYGLGGKSGLWSCSSVPEYIDEWKKINGCSEKRNVSYEKGAARCVSYYECEDGAEVVLCSIGGGGHTWPSGNWAPESCVTAPNGLRCRRYKEGVGPISYDISANDVMWEFFKNHSLK